MACELYGQPRLFEIGRKTIAPDAVLVLEIDQRRDRRRQMRLKPTTAGSRFGCGARLVWRCDFKADRER
jgi:hypothetical protein